MFVCAYLRICVLVCLGRGIFQLACHQLFVGVFSSVSLKGACLIFFHDFIHQLISVFNYSFYSFPLNFIVICSQAPLNVGWGASVSCGIVLFSVVL